MERANEALKGMMSTPHETQEEAIEQRDGGARLSLAKINPSYNLSTAAMR